jgi:hypothetical protein
LNFLLDNNLSPRIADALNVLVEVDGHAVTHVRRKFQDPRISDVEWITLLGDEGGWSVISADLRITRSQQERLAWRTARLIGFFLLPSWQKLTNLRKTALLLEWWPSIVKQAELVGPGAMFEVPLRPHAKLRQLRP